MSVDECFSAAVTPDMFIVVYYRFDATMNTNCPWDLQAPPTTPVQSGPPQNMFLYIALPQKRGSAWHLSSVWHQSFKPNWWLDNTRLTGSGVDKQGVGLSSGASEFIQLQMSGARILSAWLAVVLNVWLALFLGMFKHQNGVVDFQGRAKFDWHDLDDVLLCEQKKGPPIYLLKKE